MRRKTVKQTYDKHARDLPPVSVGQAVFYQHSVGKRWRKGQVLSREGERNYIIRDETGGTYRRNRVLIRPTQCKSQQEILLPRMPRNVLKPPQCDAPPFITQEHEDQITPPPQVTTTDGTHQFPTHSKCYPTATATETSVDARL